MTEVLSMLAFTWNAHDVRFCDSTSVSRSPRSPRSRKNTLSAFAMGTFLNCATPDFWPRIADKITTRSPFLVTFSFQDTRLNLSSEMTKLGYSVVGVGLSSSCGLYVYSRVPGIQMIQRIVTSSGITLIIKLPNNQRWGVVNICNTGGTQHLQQALKELVYTPPMEYVTIMGSFSVGPTPCPLEVAIDAPHLCNRKYDPFTSSLDEFLLKEGIDNYGPMFPPTCYLTVNREPNHDSSVITLKDFPSEAMNNHHEVSEEDYQPGKAAWCDRIWYGTFQKAFNVQLICKTYDRLDDPQTNIRLSDHAIVYGFYTFTITN